MEEFPEFPKSGPSFFHVLVTGIEFRGMLWEISSTLPQPRRYGLSSRSSETTDVPKKGTRRDWHRVGSAA